MASTAKAIILLFLVPLISSHVHIGDAQDGCQLSDMHVTQEKTGKLVGGKTQYRVTFDNQCSCLLSNVLVHCNDLASAEPIDKTKIQVASEDLCILNEGAPIIKGSPVSFTYAVKTPQKFPVLGVHTTC